jgi:hypothetical protein
MVNLDAETVITISSMDSDKIDILLRGDFIIDMDGETQMYPVSIRIPVGLVNGMIKESI